MTFSDTDSTQISVKRIFDVAMLLNNSESKQTSTQSKDESLAENSVKKSTVLKIE